MYYRKSNRVCCLTRFRALHGSECDLFNFTWKVQLHAAFNQLHLSSTVKKTKPFMGPFLYGNCIIYAATFASVEHTVRSPFSIHIMVLPKHISNSLAVNSKQLRGPLAPPISFASFIPFKWSPLRTLLPTLLGEIPNRFCYRPQNAIPTDTLFCLSMQTLRSFGPFFSSHLLSSTL